MTKLIIFGNSGSGKSTLAKQLSDKYQLAHLDLDTLAWLATMPPQRKPIIDSASQITAFIRANQNWVIEGCYSDLIELALPYSNQIIFLDLPVDMCIRNARHRPWEPHKYASKEAQDNNLDMLIKWIADYEHRTDTFSRRAHINLYDNYGGEKRRYSSNDSTNDVSHMIQGASNE